MIKKQDKPLDAHIRRLHDVNQSLPLFEFVGACGSSAALDVASRTCWSLLSRATTSGAKAAQRRCGIDAWRKPGCTSGKREKKLARRVSRTTS
jgi:hypothetical protein